MRKLIISVNGTEPFESKKKADVEHLLEQMIDIKNSFHKLPECNFTITGSKTIIVNWEYLNKIIPDSMSNGIVFTDRLVNKIIKDVTSDDPCSNCNY